jgi:hypothetical protein
MIFKNKSFSISDFIIVSVWLSIYCFFSSVVSYPIIFFDTNLDLLYFIGTLIYCAVGAIIFFIFYEICLYMFLGLNESGILFYKKWIQNSSIEKAMIKYIHRN